MRTTKTSIRIWKPLHDAFEVLVARNGLSRDNFLNHLLRVEIPKLDAEIQEANSQSAKLYIHRALRNLKPQKLVTVRLEKSLLAQLRRICAKKRIVRDAFFNRLYFLLTAERRAIDKIFFAGYDGWRKDVWAELKHDGPFYQRVFSPLQGEIDPFWAIRAGIGLIYGESVKRGEGPPDSIYDATLRDPDNEALGRELVGLNCHVSDIEIPHSKARKEFARAMAEFTGKPVSFWESE